MKVRYELDSERDSLEMIKRYAQVNEITNAVLDFKEFLRRKEKYAESEEDLTTTWEDVRQAFFEQMSNVDLNV